MPRENFRARSFDCRYKPSVIRLHPAGDGRITNKARHYIPCAHRLEKNSYINGLAPGPCVSIPWERIDSIHIQVLQGVHMYTWALFFHLRIYLSLVARGSACYWSTSRQWRQKDDGHRAKGEQTPRPGRTSAQTKHTSARYERVEQRHIIITNIQNAPERQMVRFFALRLKRRASERASSTRMRARITRNHLVFRNTRRGIKFRYTAFYAKINKEARPFGSNWITSPGSPSARK